MNHNIYIYIKEHQWLKPDQLLDLPHNPVALAVDLL
jgi:hypothetical protein